MSLRSCDTTVSELLFFHSQGECTLSTHLGQTCYPKKPPRGCCIRSFHRPFSGKWCTRIAGHSVVYGSQHRGLIHEPSVPALENVSRPLATQHRSKLQLYRPFASLVNERQKMRQRRENVSNRARVRETHDA